MVRVLKSAPAPVTLMVTGPLTTVAVALDIAPEIESKIQEIVWMGGALNVPGKVFYLRSYPDKISCLKSPTPNKDKLIYELIIFSIVLN
ncbi:nucleoside hydrolase [Okeania sp. SIO2C2]|uniref:nucleoside hydrolase n=1 Tax=Okeania sp. SIO2C2 TaxID=2607787 RepID=UPI00257DE745|nr:nucleoside hydrolase [Okeania sp. SIO2C2]